MYHFWTSLDLCALGCEFCLCMADVLNFGRADINFGSFLLSGLRGSALISE